MLYLYWHSDSGHRVFYSRTAAGVPAAGNLDETQAYLFNYGTVNLQCNIIHYNLMRDWGRTLLQLIHQNKWIPSQSYTTEKQDNDHFNVVMTALESLQW